MFDYTIFRRKCCFHYLLRMSYFVLESKLVWLTDYHVCTPINSIPIMIIILALLILLPASKTSRENQINQWRTGKQTYKLVASFITKVILTMDYTLLSTAIVIYLCKVKLHMLLPKSTDRNFLTQISFSIKWSLTSASSTTLCVGQIYLFSTKFILASFFSCIGSKQKYDGWSKVVSQNISCRAVWIRQKNSGKVRISKATSDFSHMQKTTNKDKKSTRKTGKQINTDREIMDSLISLLILSQLRVCAADL